MEDRERWTGNLQFAKSPAVHVAVPIRTNGIWLGVFTNFTSSLLRLALVNVGLPAGSNAKAVCNLNFYTFRKICP